jgi:enoyl-CoA hydratase/carnithine racemase
MHDVAPTSETFGPSVILQITGPVARLFIANPTLNLLTSAILHNLRQALAHIATRNDLRVLVLAGGGDKAFIAGVDIYEMVELNPRDARVFITLFHSVMADLRRLPIPVIASIHGYALGGGCEMAMACDLRIASEQAMFGMPEVRLGIPSVIEAALMPALIGTARTMELLFTGQMIKARTAYQWGLVNRVVPVAELDATVENMIRKLLQSGPKALEAQKKLVYQWMDSTMSHAFQLGIEAFTHAYRSDEPKEGMKAFLEKRKPSWAL